MAIPIDPPPIAASLTDSTVIVISGNWFRWISKIWARVLTLAQVIGSTATFTNQSVAIATTTLATVTQGGLYRLSAYLRVMVVDGVSSSFQLTLTWREGSQTCTKTFTEVTGDTVTSFENESLTVLADSGTLITYAIAYASNTPSKMRYRGKLAAELIA